MVAEAFGLADRLALELLPGEACTTVRTEARADWRELLLGRTAAVGSGAADRTVLVSILLRAASTGLHEGHLRMACLAAERLRMPVEFEMSIENVDKPPLDYTEMERRSAQFGDGTTFYATRVPLSERSPNCFPAVHSSSGR